LKNLRVCLHFLYLNGYAVWWAALDIVVAAQHSTMVLTVLTILFHEFCWDLTYFG
jgi:hypothetical protein